jgi:LCP family protein required for cell wall assembly
VWVSIPGYDYARINTAYMLGTAYDDPSGGGPGLAMKTVEQLLGVPIDYYAVIDFSAFEQFIDDLGGINMTVYQDMAVDPIGKENTVFLKPGNYLFNGPTALAYARARHTEGGDFDRAQRQQQVILAIEDRILELGPAKIAARVPDIYQEISAGINTNLSLDDALRLGWLILDIPRENIKQGAIAAGAVMMARLTGSDGVPQDVLIPVPDQVRLIRDQVFASSDMASPGLSSGDSRANMEAEGASIVVSNGSYAEGLAATTQAYLQSQGAKVVGTQNSEYTTYTRIIDYTGKPYTDRYLVDLMNITKYSIEFQYTPDSPVDVLVILGDDWAGNNPMP